MEYNIDLEGRKLVNFETKKLSPTNIVSISTYDDGTIIELQQNTEKINVKSNKKLIVQSDGVTVKIV